MLHGTVHAVGIGQGDVLTYLSPECHRQRLYAAANAEHRYLTVVGQAGEHEFGAVALCVDMVELWCRFLTAPQRVEVRAAGEQQSVEMLECVDECVVVVDGWNEYRRAAGFDHLHIIFVPNRSVAVIEIGRQTDERLLLRFGEGGVDLVEVLRQRKAFEFHST